MLTLRYFASFRERLHCEEERLESNAETLDALMTELAERGGVWSQIFSTRSGVRVARNQEMVPVSTRIERDDEIAFFPPVTGG